MDGLLGILKTYQLFGLIAFVVTVLATTVVIRLARAVGVLDMPDRRLKPHVRPTPYLGGAAICLGWAVALTVAMVNDAANWQIMGPVLLGGVAITVVGLLDDLRELSAKLRLGLTSAIIAAVLLTTGAGLGLVDALLVPLHLSAPDAIVVPISFVVSILVVLGACNSTNLIDGLDGLCSGVTAIVSLGFFFLAANLAAVGFSQEGDPARLVLAIAMFGAAVGFLPLNFNPARIFMGDAGSMLLGFNCGMMILLFAERGILRWVLGGLMVFALPIADTALAIVRRWRSGRPIFAGDRSHFYDQLADRGISVRRVVAISYVVAAFYAVMGCLSIWLRTRYVLPLYLLVAIATVVTLSALKMMKVEPPSAVSGRVRTLRLLFTSAGRRVSLIRE
ncbi:MAG: glycosyltransferase family 4 protein, partial [Planctomycetota bacterium]